VRLLAARSIIVILLCSLFVVSCRKWPDQPEPTPTQVQGFYVGVGNLDGGPTNVLLEVMTSDSLGNLRGTIIYRSDTLVLTEIRTNAAVDTLWYSYTRESLLHRAVGLIVGAGLTVRYSEPIGIPTFRLNREVGSFNMSGQWTGQMTSTQIQDGRDATMLMNQEGTLFLGTVSISIYQSLTFSLSSGAANGSDYQLAGSVRVGTSTLSTLFYGNYSTSDRIGGFWQMGDNGSTDHGEFLFTRSFQ
jgi:hypothetical protein